MRINLTDSFRVVANSANQEEDDHHYHKRMDMEYARSDSNLDTGRISLGHDNRANSKIRKAEERDRKDRYLRDFIDRALNGFYTDMALWDLSDFHNHGESYRGWLRQRADTAYENGDYLTYQSLSERAQAMYDRETTIFNSKELSDNEKKNALIELWKDQDQELVEEFSVKFEGSRSMTLLEAKNQKHVQEARAPISETKASNDMAKVPGFTI